MKLPTIKNVVWNKNILIIILVALLVATGIFGYRYYRNYQTILIEKTSMIDGLSGELKLEREKNGSLTAQVFTIQSENTDMILAIETKDIALKQLQEAIKRTESKNKELESIVSAQGIIIAEYKDSITNIVIGGDTINDTIFPIYQRDFALKNTFDKTDSTIWISGLVILGKSTFDLSLNVVNKYDVIVGRERKNIFKPWKAYAEITTFNPYDNVKMVRSYSKTKLKPKRFGLGASAGITYSAEKVRPYIGLGVNYNIIEF